MKKVSNNQLITRREAKKLAKEQKKKMYIASCAIIYRTLIDKHGFSEKDINNLFANVVKLTLSIHEGRINTQDIIQSLKDEDGIDFEMSYNERM